MPNLKTLDHGYQIFISIFGVSASTSTRDGDMPDPRYVTIADSLLSFC